jgi:hypothetical protein
MRSEKMIRRAHKHFASDRDNVARFLAPVLILCASLALASCSSFSGYVSDHWPMWAGGMPNDVPPRPGAPGYEEFISHQQARDEAAANAAAAKQGATPAVGTAPAGAPPPRPLTDNTGNLPAMPPGAQRVNDQSAVQGGLY